MLKSPGIRFLMVGLLALFMFVPLIFVSELVKERAEYSRATISNISREWGGAQLLSGPQMIVPIEGPETRLEQREVQSSHSGGQNRIDTFEVTEIVSKPPLYLSPDQFDVLITTTTEERHRGVFEVPVYTATADLDFDFSFEDAQALLAPGEVALWDQARIQIGISSNHALRGLATLTADGQSLNLSPTMGQGGITAPLGDPRDIENYHLTLGFNGAESLSIAPSGRNSVVTMNSDWPHPSFNGTFLPNTSDIRADGFSAEWVIPHLARNVPRASRENFQRASQSDAFGFKLYQPNDFYQKAYRAANYGILFISLTFLSVLLIEDRKNKPVHPIQYLLIGLAQALFVVLMVAYAEQIGFAASYLISSVATIGLLTFFAFVGLKFGRRSWILAGILVVLYSVLYLILRSVDFALVAGATFAFAALAGMMIATRNENWYGNSEHRNWFRKPAEP